MSAYLILSGLAAGVLFFTIVGMYIETIRTTNATLRYRNRLMGTLKNQARRAQYRKTRLEKAAQRELQSTRVLTNGHSRRHTGNWIRELTFHPQTAARRDYYQAVPASLEMQGRPSKSFTPLY